MKMLNQRYLLPRSNQIVRITDVEMTREPPYQPIYTMLIDSGKMMGAELRLTCRELELNEGVRL